MQLSWIWGSWDWIGRGKKAFTLCHVCHNHTSWFVVLGSKCQIKVWTNRAGLNKTLPNIGSPPQVVHSEVTTQFWRIFKRAQKDWLWLNGRIVEWVSDRKSVWKQGAHWKLLLASALAAWKQRAKAVEPHVSSQFNMICRNAKNRMPFLSHRKKKRASVFLGTRLFSLPFSLMSLKQQRLQRKREIIWVRNFTGLWLWHLSTFKQLNSNFNTCKKVFYNWQSLLWYECVTSRRPYNVKPCNRKRPGFWGSEWVFNILSSCVPHIVPLLFGLFTAWTEQRAILGDNNNFLGLLSERQRGIDVPDTCTSLLALCPFSETHTCMLRGWTGTHTEPQLCALMKSWMIISSAFWLFHLYSDVGIRKNVTSVPKQDGRHFSGVMAVKVENDSQLLWTADVKLERLCE